VARVPKDNLRPESVVVAAGRPTEPGSPLSTPIVPVAPYRHGDGDNRYARHDLSPTVTAFEAAVGALEGGTALAFASGMGAASAVIDRLALGSSVVVPQAGYSGVVELFGELAAADRLTVRAVDPADTAAVVAALDGADLLWIETVSNPLMAVADLPALIAAAHEVGALVCVDATFSTPLVVRPLELGADVVMHSATKYLSGHGDTMLGAVVTADDQLYDVLKGRRDLVGAIPGTLEAWLALRGLRTLHLRLDRAESNARTLVERLREHAAVTEVRYPGFGGIVSIVLAGGVEGGDLLVRSTSLWVHATSLGGVESTFERRRRWKSEPATIPDGLVRLSVGVEDVEDLWRDLSGALDRLP